MLVVLKFRPPSLQLTKEKPEAALALTVTDEPHAFVPPPLVVPPIVGELLVITPLETTEKLAVRVSLFATVKV